MVTMEPHPLRGPMQGGDADGRICLLQHSTLTPLPKELGRKPLGLELGSRAKALTDYSFNEELPLSSPFNTEQYSHTPLLHDAFLTLKGRLHGLLSSL